MPVVTKKNLADTALAFLTARPGMRFDNVELAQQFGADPKVMRLTLAALREAGKISTVVISQRRYYLSRVAQVLPPPPERVPCKPPTPWVMPSAMRDRLREIAAHRAAFPSKYAD